jgi:Putative binding domain, N-terminal
MNQSRGLLVLVGLVAASLAGACGDDKTPTNPSTTCTFTVGQPSVAAFPPEGGTGTVAVTTASTCSWTAASGSTFITITQGASGTGNGTVQFTVAANTATSERTGTMTIAGSTVMITQRGATGTQPPPTSVTLSAPSANSPVGGVTVTTARPTLVVNNSTATGNAGTVTYRFEVSDLSSFPNDPVRTFTADGVAQGSGGTTGWVVTRDLGPAVLWYWRARATNGTVTSEFSNVETFRTAGACSFAVSPTSVNAPAGGGTFTVNVTTDAACSWTASSQSDFITITSGASGTGNGAVTFTVPAGGSRTGTLMVAGQTVTVTQGGSNISASFRLLDPGRLGAATTTECQIRSLTSTPTVCTLESTSFPTGTNTITGYSWVVSYTYPNEKSDEHESDLQFL